VKKTEGCPTLEQTSEAVPPGGSRYIVDEASGMRSEELRCAKHGCWYLRTYIKTLAVWTGRCEQCGAEEEQELQARALLEKRKGELRAKVEDLLPNYEAQVREQTEKDVAAYTASIRPDFEAEVRRRLWEQLHGQIETEELAKLVAELKSAKGAN